MRMMNRKRKDIVKDMNHREEMNEATVMMESIKKITVLVIASAILKIEEEYQPKMKDAVAPAKHG
jgi:mannose-1-phosphate guanylyltransferase